MYIHTYIHVYTRVSALLTRVTVHRHDVSSNFQNSNPFAGIVSSHTCTPHLHIHVHHTLSYMFTTPCTYVHVCVHIHDTYTYTTPTHTCTPYLHLHVHHTLSSMCTVTRVSPISDELLEFKSLRQNRKYTYVEYTPSCTCAVTRVSLCAPFLCG